MSSTRKIFVSYKYKDFDVSPVSGNVPGEDTDYRYTPRHYVDKIIDLVCDDNIYKGEKSDEDASHLSDSSIKSKLKDKLFDSTVTIVLLSPNMRDKSKPQKNQWIPQEIAYSLRTQSRTKTNGNKYVSNTNGILAVALPDSNGSYNYVVQRMHCGVDSWYTGSLFDVIKSNMFNRVKVNKEWCSSCFNYHHIGADHSYIHPVRWCEFIENYQVYIDHSVDLMNKEEEFNLTKKI